MPSSSGDKLCPICDSPLQPGSKKCSFCGTDLSIFDIEMEAETRVSEQAAPQPKTSLENKIEEILKPRPVETPPTRPVAAPAPKPEPPKPERTISQVVEARKAPEPPKPAPPPVVEEPKEYFECPQCGTAVETTASSCPKCGVMFAEEGADVFECPACSTLVPLDATTCPGCGAVFVEEGGAPPAEPPATPSPEPQVVEVEPPPEKAVTPEPAPSEAAPEEKSRGFMGLFKRKKEQEQAPTQEKPTPAPAAQAPKARPPPEKPAAPQVVREVAPSPAPKPVAARPPVVEAPAGKDKGRDLARMVAEMKPLLAIARDKDVDIGESKQLIDEAAMAGRERQLDKAIDLVQKSKAVLMGKIDAQLGQLVLQLNEETKAAREFGGDISRATTYMQELARARASGDVEAAYVYVEKVQKELHPITGRYNESKKKISGLKQYISNCEVFIVDTKDARRFLVDSTKAFDQKDFDRVDSLVKQANDSLSKAIPLRMTDEMQKARDELLDARVRNVNITPMLTVLKSATNMMKSGDYPQAIKEMREFKEMMKKSA